jgi:hypothetical protein
MMIEESNKIKFQANGQNAELGEKEETQDVTGDAETYEMPSLLLLLLLLLLLSSPSSSKIRTFRLKFTSSAIKFTCCAEHLFARHGNFVGSWMGTNSCVRLP